jgi:hypothetical protein
MIRSHEAAGSVFNRIPEFTPCAGRVLLFRVPIAAAVRLQLPRRGRSGGGIDHRPHRVGGRIQSRLEETVLMGVHISRSIFTNTTLIRSA